MLTDRQKIALELFKFTVDSPLGISYMARNIEGTKKLIKDALTVAELFLENSSIPDSSKQIPDEIISQLQANNKSLQQINDALLDSQYFESTSGN
jgi:hypothetical protein